MIRLVAFYPINEELRFFRKTVRRMRLLLNKEFSDNRLSNYKISHEQSLSALAKIPKETLLLFFLHGHTNSLLGCSYKRNNLSNHPKKYVHGPFIDNSNIHILKQRKIICVSCNSNSFAKHALEAGARVVLGFDEINFDTKELIENGTWNKHVVNNSKYLFRKALYWSICSAYEKNLSFAQFHDKLQLALSKFSSNIVLDNLQSNRIQYYKRVANCLDEITNGIATAGDSSLKLFD